jgi:hypothetical protein
VWDGIGSVSASPGSDPISTEPEPNGKNLRNSDLSGTDLNGVNLNSANLSGSNLSKSNLEMADLSKSNLTGANLADAKLTGANFTQAIVDPDDWDLLSLTQQDEAIRANSLPSGAPIISGLGQSNTLTIDTAALSDADGLGVLSFQWYRAGIELLGETSLTYKLSEADIGSVISAKTSYTDGYGNNEKFTAVTEREIELWDQNGIDPIDIVPIDPIDIVPIDPIDIVPVDPIDIVPVDIVPTPTIDLNDADGIVDAVEVKSWVGVTGTAFPGSRVELISTLTETGGSMSFYVDVDADGKWSMPYEGNNFPDGTYALSFRTLHDGNQSDEVKTTLELSQIKHTPFKITADGGKYYIDGVLTPELELVSGHTYQFDLSDSSLNTHPLRFNMDGKSLE